MEQNKRDKDMKDDNDKEPAHCEEHFKLFSYLSMAIVTIAIIVGSFIILQHLQEEEAVEKTLANQETLMENQKLLLNNQEAQIKTQELLKQLLNESRAHEDREEFILGNNTSTNIKISSSNSEKLDQAIIKLNKIIRQLNIPMANITG